MDILEQVVAVPFVILRPPNLKLKLPSIHAPEPMTAFAFVMFTYFLFTGGLIYGLSHCESVVPREMMICEVFFQ